MQKLIIKIVVYLYISSIGYKNYFINSYRNKNYAPSKKYKKKCLNFNIYIVNYHKTIILLQLKIIKLSFLT